MKIAGFEPSMSCLKDNCFTIKQYFLPYLLSLLLYYIYILIYWIGLIRTNKLQTQILVTYLLVYDPYLYIIQINSQVVDLLSPKGRKVYDPYYSGSGPPLPRRGSLRPSSSHYTNLSSGHWTPPKRSLLPIFKWTKEKSITYLTNILLNTIINILYIYILILYIYLYITLLFNYYCYLKDLNLYTLSNTS